ncbi:MAG: V-type ATP synthase subunit E family protein [Promethearchaeia archaeon]
MDDKILRKKFGKLSLYLMDVAERKIKDIYQQTIFQKAEIRKRYFERLEINDKRIREHFIETYMQYLNNFLSNTLLDIKKKILDLKKRIIKDIKNEIINYLRNRINENYKEYLNMIKNRIIELSTTIDRPPKVILIFNSKDYDYFIKNENIFDKIFKNPIKITKSKEDFIGGFKALYGENEIMTDFTFNLLIEKSSTMIESKLVKIISDINVSEVERKIENIIKEKKKKIEDYLEEYDGQ